MARGIPGGVHGGVLLLPSPPSLLSRRPASQSSWYSAVRGACCARPGGLLGSHCPPVSGRLIHWPFQSGYLESSNASAPVRQVPRSTRAIAIRCSMTVLPRSGTKTNHCGASAPSSPLRLLLRLEVAQVGRRLILARGHQLPVGADHVDLVAELDMRVVLRADRLAPPVGLVDLGVAAVVLCDRPGMRQRIVDSGYLVLNDVVVLLVRGETFLHDGIAVLVHRDAGRVVGAGQLEPARLDHERVVPAVAILIQPLADRVAGEHRLHVLWPVTPVGVDAP